MILRDRVGGGGRAKALSFVSLAAEERRRALTVSAGCVGYIESGDTAGSEWDLGSVGDVREPEGDIRFGSWIAGGGNSKES